jgi:putative endonuclease
MPSEHHYYVYLLTNQNNKVMYVGMTNNLVRRMHEHKAKLVLGLTEKYHVNKLVYFEETIDVHAAITREKEIKKWRREKKNNLVAAVNPEWNDLSDGWFEISRCARNDRNR